MKAKPISRMHGNVVRHASRGRRDQRDLERPAMDSSSNSTKSVPSAKIMPGAPFLRYYANHQLVAWQPEGMLDDRMLDEIAEWVVPTEKALQFNRFVDLSKLKEVQISTRHVLPMRKGEQRSSPELNLSVQRSFANTGSASGWRAYMKSS